MDDLLKITILGIVQGITEFLPISSNAHLIIVEQLLNYKNNNEILNLVFHLGSLLAIITYFFSELLGLFKKPKIILNLIIATLPVIITGYFVFKFRLIDYENFSIKIIAITTIVFGIILFCSDKIKITKKLYTDLNAKKSFIIGLFQVIALIPGVSRSGITLTAGRFLGYSRLDAAKFSFFLSIPTTSGACFHFFALFTLLGRTRRFFNPLPALTPRIWSMSIESPFRTLPAEAILALAALRAARFFFCWALASYFLSYE